MSRRTMGDVNNSVTGTVHGNIEQAGRDIIHGHDALATVAKLHAALASLEPGGAARRTAEHELDAIERELRRPEPDKAEVSRRLTRFLDVIRDAGGLVASGVSVAGALGIFAG
jgi:hypothetical protein